ncbi:hypothetical protein BJY04DRAFT_217347 [Aspergillus karnatakaensis]|uniref:uncharacterized protein n=1 Tax=Aspergillus karnatakaensis TaxID=1810916 RepID=UPI003CCE4606
MSFQDILGQLPLLKSYSHILLCFSLPDSQREPGLVALRFATKRLLKAFPFLAGNVVHTGVQPGHSGTFTVEDFTPDSEPSTEKLAQVLQINNLSSILPPYNVLAAARAPQSMLPGNQIAPRRPAFPRTYTETSAPVLECQVTLIQGGLLLTLAAQHNIIDATGMMYIASVLSLFMNGHPGPVPKKDLVMGNCDRRHLIPILAQDEPLPEDMGVFTQPPPLRLSLDELGEYRWYLLHFPAESLRAIHEEGHRIPKEFAEGVKSVSVNDTLSAWIWQRLTTVRSALFKSSPTSAGSEGLEGKEQTTQLTRAADLRRPLSLPPSYMGHMVRTANLRLPISTVTTSSLSYLSSLLRTCVKAHTTPESITAYATLIHRTPDKSKILYAAGFHPTWDLSCSSLAHFSLPRFGGLLGKLEFMRRPNFGPLPSGMYIIEGVDRGESSGGKGAEAMVCLRGVEMEGLMRDQGWRRFVEVFDMGEREGLKAKLA